MQYKAVIFDLDGVLCSTDYYHYLAWKKITDRLGIPFSKEDNDHLRGISREASLEIILQKSRNQWSTSQKRALAEEKNRIYQNYLAQMSPDDLLDGIPETLVTLRSLGFLLAVGSSSKNTLLILSRLGLDNFFDAVADGTEISHSKPDPEVFFLAAKKLRVAPSESVVVEDSIAGIDAAKAGGFYAVSFGDSAKKSSADCWISHMSQLLHILF